MNDDVFNKSCITTKTGKGDIMVCVFPDDPSSVVLITGDSVLAAESPAHALESLVEHYGVRDPKEINRIADFISQRYRAAVDDYARLFRSMFASR